MSNPRRAVENEEAPGPRRAPIVIAVTTVAALAIGAGIWAVNNRTAEGQSAPSATTGASVGGCPTEQSIVVDPSVAPVLESVAKSYGASLGAECTPITVVVKPSKAVAQEGLGTAAGWVPEDVTWQGRATGGDGTLADAPQRPLGWSPIVVVAPKELTDELGGRALTGATLTDLITTRKTFADYGHADWGRFKLVAPAPAESLTGAAAFASLSRQVANGQEFPISAATATAEQRLMPSVQWRTVAQPAPADVPTQLGANPADAPASLGVGPRAGVTSEMVALNQGAKTPGMKAWLLDGGRSGVQVSLVAPAGNPTIDGFQNWLTAEPGKQALLRAGLRVGDQTPQTDQLKALGLSSEGIAPTTGVGPMNWGLLTQVYAAFSHRSSTLVMMDVSGSMGEKYPGTNLRRVDVVAQAAAQSWTLWPPGSVTGMITFNTDNSDRPQFSTVLPLQANNTPEYLEQLPRFSRSFEQIQTQGGTPLYEAVWVAYETSQKNYRSGYTNTIVILTDGRNEDSTSTMTVEALIDRIKKADPNKKVNIGLVGLGEASDFGSLKRIADETGNRAWLVQDPRQVADVLPQIEIAFSN